MARGCSNSSVPRSAPSRRSPPDLRSPASGGVPAWDPRSTPALVQLNAITSPIFAGIGRSPVPVLLPFDTAGYLEAGADGAADCRCRAIRPTSAPQTCFTPAPPATTRCFRWIPTQATACRSGRSPGRSKCRSPARTWSTISPIRAAARARRSRRWRRSSRTCAASSAKAMCATPSRASAFPMWCRSSASTRRRVRGGWPAARPIRSPSVS